MSDKLEADLPYGLVPVLRCDKDERTTASLTDTSAAYEFFMLFA